MYGNVISTEEFVIVTFDCKINPLKLFVKVTEVTSLENEGAREISLYIVVAVATFAENV